MTAQKKDAWKCRVDKRAEEDWGRKEGGNEAISGEDRPSMNLARKCRESPRPAFSGNAAQPIGESSPGQAGQGRQTGQDGDRKRVGCVCWSDGSDAPAVSVFPVSQRLSASAPRQL